MTAAAAGGESSPSFVDASPARVRAAPTPEDAAAFDPQWQRLMARSTGTLDLAEVHQALDDWRRVEWLTVAGERPDGSVPWSRPKTEPGLAE
ncbi:MAG: hypothetical protein J0I34_24960 [Pseudonocardia sp.]|uniref:DUF6247 family protein n=1 Tax=unclassified Pseudonocardia TaxID=2619320 RepID=UPI00086ABCEC|nr:MULTISPECIES: DUF6247 family protein [unclassified Pseudonocardia]MBN9112021.1 hypothetical protein [Pseudonocardia sp.]ODU25990.1 MAG: hypothetical protein ABS80_08530 [Pseudonocardia sp. SCN 72-51]ODV06054.1 MAG: hypothetical protein ABT15_14685 [Pseudonocardia sp. SCN 73-27]